MLFASNHGLPLDNGLIIKSMPTQWRRRLAVAGAMKLWHNPFWAVINPLLGNGCPISQEGAVRASFDYLGRIIDRGWSVLIYPEGELTVGGPIQPFLSGTGLLAVEGRMTLVPLRLHVQSMGTPSRFPFLRRGTTEVRFGTPLTFSPQTSYEDATAAIEEAVNSL